MQRRSLMVRHRKMRGGNYNAPSPNFENIDESINCSDNVQQYMLNSTLHGLRYVGDPKISIFERTFFGASFVLVFSLSVYFILNVYAKWTASPIIISLNAAATSISDIPFPAVTICNMNQARESRVRNLTDESEETELLQSLCGNSVNFTATRSNRTNWTRFRMFLKKVSQPCAGVLILCRFATERKKCMNIFNTVLTDEGLCCIFNRVDPDFLLKNYNGTDEFDTNEDDDDKTKPVDWTPEKGFVTTDRRNIYPRPAAGSGSHMGLTVLINVNVNEYHCSTTNSAGFKVLLHNPIETPKIADYGFFISAGFESRVVITPRISDASTLIRKVPARQRQCVFSDEGNLSYFRTYSRKNCEMECESRILIEQCGCVLYYMPRISDNTTICNRDNWQCYESIKLAIELATNDTFHCNCLPGCFEISYDAEISTARLGTEGFAVREHIITAAKKEFVEENFALMHVYYESSYYRSSSKEELIGFTEFLCEFKKSNTGGLLGLFMGFSVVSLIEIFYFMTIRPYCAARMKMKAATVKVKQSRNDGGNKWTVWRKQTAVLSIPTVESTVVFRPNYTFGDRNSKFLE